LLTFFKSILLLTAVFVITGCSSPAERARAQAQYAAQQEASAHQYCSGSLGLKRGSGAYANCRLSVEQMRSAKSARDAAARQKGNQALIDLGNQIRTCGLGGQYC
jgi:hypothetical protein